MRLGRCYVWNRCRLYRLRLGWCYVWNRCRLDSWRLGRRCVRNRCWRLGRACVWNRCRLNRRRLGKVVLAGAMVVVVVMPTLAHGLFWCAAVVAVSVGMLPVGAALVIGVAVGTNGIPPLTCIPCNMGAIACPMGDRRNRSGTSRMCEGTPCSSRSPFKAASWESCCSCDERDHRNISSRVRQSHSFAAHTSLRTALVAQTWTPSGWFPRDANPGCGEIRVDLPLKFQLRCRKNIPCCRPIPPCVGSCQSHARVPKTERSWPAPCPGIGRTRPGPQ